MSPPQCTTCGCTDPSGERVHAIAAALAVDDLDRALDAGMLTTSACPGCSEQCTQRLLAARDSRVRALGARERFRARQTRLQRRAEERAAARNTAPSTTAASNGKPSKPALPAAAAAALARAKARAARRGNH